MKNTKGRPRARLAGRAGRVFCAVALAATMTPAAAFAAEEEPAAEAGSATAAPLATQEEIEAARGLVEQKQQAVDDAQEAFDAAQAALQEAQDNEAAARAKGVEAFWRFVGDDEAADLIAGIPEGSIGPTAQNAYEGNAASGTSALNLDNLGVAIDIMKTANEYRESVGLDPMLVDSYLMAVSVGAADYADDYYGNIEAGTSSHQVARDNNAGENLAWNYSVSGAFYAWYDEEKRFFDNATQALYGETYEGADAFNAYFDHGSEIEAWLAENQNGESVGHYINLLRGYLYTGAGFAQWDSADGFGWDVFEQSFDSYLKGTAYTVDELSQRYDAYLASITPDPDLQAACDQASRDLESAKAELEEAKRVLAELEKADLAPLQASMQAAEALLADVEESPDGSNVLVTDRWATPSAIAALKAEMADAEEVLGAQSPTQDEADAAKAALDEVISSFEASVSYGKRFTDVTGWETEWVAQASEAGLMTGIRGSDGQLTGEFQPSGGLTRAQAVLVLYRASTGAADDEPIDPDCDMPFTDIGDAPQYYWNAAQWAWDNGVVKGGEDPVTHEPVYEFRPDETISRQELALMVWRAAGSPTAQDTSAYDAALDAGTEWDSATPALQWTAEQDILSGAVAADGSTNLQPGNPTLRGQAAKIFVTSVRFL